MPAAYATPADLTAYLPDGTAVTEPDRLLERASSLLDRVITAPFAVDPDTDLPTDAAIAAALRDACCAQVEQWLEVGEENDVDGLAGTELRIDQFSGKRAPRLAPRAADVLLTAGLVNAAARSSIATEFFGALP